MRRTARALVGLGLLLAMANGGWALAGATCARGVACPMMAAGHAGCGAATAELAAPMPCCARAAVPTAPTAAPAIVAPAPADAPAAGERVAAAAALRLAPSPRAAQVPERARDVGLHALGLFTLFADFRI